MPAIGSCWQTKSGATRLGFAALLKFSEGPKVDRRRNCRKSVSGSWRVRFTSQPKHVDQYRRKVPDPGISPGSDPVRALGRGGVEDMDALRGWLLENVLSQ